jgi:hypothetical protein
MEDRRRLQAIRLIRVHLAFVAQFYAVSFKNWTAIYTARYGYQYYYCYQCFHDALQFLKNIEFKIRRYLSFRSDSFVGSI